MTYYYDYFDAHIKYQLPSRGTDYRAYQYIKSLYNGKAIFITQDKINNKFINELRKLGINFSKRYSSSIQFTQDTSPIIETDDIIIFVDIGDLNLISLTLQSDDSNAEFYLVFKG